MVSQKRRFALFAPHRLHPLGSKTANGLIMFRPAEVAVVIDPSKAGRNVQDVLGYGGDIPIVSNLEEALSYTPDTLVVGIAPIGGAIDPLWIPDLLKGLDSGLQVWAGLHQFLGDRPEMEAHQDKIWDARKPPQNLKVARGTWRNRKSKVILTIGSDSNVGKMTTALTLQKHLREMGLESVFIGTGQTGMMISERGVAVDAVVSDFVNGAVEAEIDKVDGQAPLIIVEGQGAVTHMGYSGVTMGLIHGSMPDAFVLAHQPSRKLDDYQHPLPSISNVIHLHEALMSPFKATKILGINVYSKDLTPEEGQAACESCYEEVGLPVEDMVKAPKGIIAQNVMRVLFPNSNILS